MNNEHQEIVHYFFANLRRYSCKKFDFPWKEMPFRGTMRGKSKHSADYTAERHVIP
jgi:hypothetical protein